LKITPEDIKSQNFSKRLKGYDQGEVDAFLSLVALDLQELSKEHSRVKEKLSLLESRMVDYEDMEKVIHEVLLKSQKSAEEVKKNAEKEAELLVREAKLKNERMLEETHAVLSELKKQIIELKDLKRSYILRLKSILETQMRILESMENEDESYKREPQTMDEFGQKEGS
jgi:cell division initiation protein